MIWLRAVAPWAVALLLTGCGGDERASQPTGGIIDLQSLRDWQRVAEPVLRDPVPGEPYEVASDGHVFRDAAGGLHMVYTGEGAGRVAIKLASSADWTTWSVTGALLAGDGPTAGDRNRETSFHRVAADGTHQLYYIGYPNETTYESQIYLARADALEGPYDLPSEPIIARGPMGGESVYLMTSPSVVEQGGQLYLVFIAWNDDPNHVTTVWTMASTSSDDGATWSPPEKVEVPVRMEGQLTAGPDGRFYAVRTSDYLAPGDTTRVEAIYLAVADHPLGPYESLAEPVLIQTGAPWETDECTAAQLSFDASTKTAYLYYAGADHNLGWWIMLARSSYTTLPPHG